MSTRTLIGIALFGVATTGAILANLFVTMMIGEINRKKNDGELVSYFGFTLPKLLRIAREYGSLYPGGKLRAYFVMALGASVMAAVAMARCFRIL